MRAKSYGAVFAKKLNKLAHNDKLIKMQNSFLFLIFAILMEYFFCLADPENFGSEANFIKIKSVIVL